MDGLEATRQIRAHEIRNGLSPVTIIALTGVASTETQQEANSSGVNLFLIKPVRLADLEVVLKGVVTGQEKAEREERERENQGTVQSHSRSHSLKEQLQTKTQAALMPPPQIQLPAKEVMSQAQIPQAQVTPQKQPAPHTARKAEQSGVKPEHGSAKAETQREKPGVTVKEIK
jgi:CheY-like chemotaxis protein